MAQFDALLSMNDLQHYLQQSPCTQASQDDLCLEERSSFQQSSDLFTLNSETLKVMIGVSASLFSQNQPDLD